MKKRLDILVTERGLAESREKAKALIMAGQIYVDNQKADKPGDTFPEECRIVGDEKAMLYLAKAMLMLRGREQGCSLSFRSGNAPRAALCLTRI